MGTFVLFAELIFALWASGEWLRTLAQRQQIDPLGWVIATSAVIFLSLATLVRLAPITVGHSELHAPASSQLLLGGWALMCTWSSGRLASRQSPIRARFWLDAAMVSTAFLAVGWPLLLAPVLRTSGDSRYASASTLIRTAVLTHRVGDLLMLSALILLCSRLPSLRSGSMLFMLLSQMTVLTTDVLEARINESDPLALPAVGVEAGWAIGLLLLAVTARRLRQVLLLSTEPVPPVIPGRPVGRFGLTLPYLPLVGIVVFAGVRATTHTAWTPTETWLSIIVCLVVCSRQMLVLYDNRRLLLAVGEREQLLGHQAFHDPLTGLPNRLLFGEKLAAAVAALPGEHDLALLFCDLDDFKRVNDNLGHAAGDRLLCIAAQRLSECAPEGAMVARLGGDEFALLVTGGTISAETAAALIMEAFKNPVLLDDDPLLVVVSIGIGQAKAGEVCSAEQLLRQADLAMLAAKSQGKGRYAVFDSAMKPADLHDRTLVNEFAAALRSGQIYPAYQPIVDLISGRIVGLEALARWDHPTRGAIPPRQFIQLAEITGLMGALTSHMLRAAVADHLTWRTQDAPSPYISVNIAPSLLLRPDFPMAVNEAISAGLPATSLVLELTGTKNVSPDPRVDAMLNDLHTQGVRLALDDFGLGNQLLSNLRRLPISMIKIDRSIVAGAGTSLRDDALMASYVDLGRRLAIPVIAVGIEQLRDCERLRELGCASGQGFLFCEPISAAEVAAQLTENAAGLPAPGIPGPRPHAGTAPRLR